eukprot:6763045-Alexandrium_andersonii.AAC.1
MALLRPRGVLVERRRAGASAAGRVAPTGAGRAGNCARAVEAASRVLMTSCRRPPPLILQRRPPPDEIDWSAYTPIDVGDSA